MLPICVQTVFVPDLKQAVAFFQSALGYEVKANYGDCITQLRTGATTLIVQQIEPGTGPQAPMTVLSFQTEDIHAAMRSVVEAGGELLHETPMKCPVGVYVMFRDKAGVVHDLLQFEKA